MECSTKDLSMEAFQIAINSCFKQSMKFSIPNVLLNNNRYEADMLIINQSNYAYEVEIKRSISDLKADFKKNHFHNSIFIRKLYFAVTEEIAEKAIDIIPEWAGIIEIRNLNNDGFAFAFITREAKPIPTARKLSIEDVARFAYLGTLRMWNLKEQHIHYAKQLKKIHENQNK